MWLAVIDLLVWCLKSLVGNVFGIFNGHYVRGYSVTMKLIKKEIEVTPICISEIKDQLIGVLMIWKIQMEKETLIIPEDQQSLCCTEFGTTSTCILSVAPSDMVKLHIDIGNQPSLGMLKEHKLVFHEVQESWLKLWLLEH